MELIILIVIEIEMQVIKLASTFVHRVGSSFHESLFNPQMEKKRKDTGVFSYFLGNQTHGHQIVIRLKVLGLNTLLVPKVY